MGSEIQFHKTYYHRKRISAFLINENYLADGQEVAWLLVAVVEPIHKQFLRVYIKTCENDSS
jgi:hypothetical protein